MPVLPGVYGPNDQPGQQSSPLPQSGGGPWIVKQPGLPVMAGLRLWLAADRITAADGDQISTWSDQSGLGFDGTAQIAGAASNPLYKVGRTPAGGPAVNFPNSGPTNPRQWFSFADVMASAAAGEIFLVLKAPAGDTGLHGFSPAFSGDECHYPYAGVVYDCFGLATGQRKSFTPSQSITTFRKYNVVSTGSVWQASLDNTVEFSTSTAVTVGWSTTPILGAGTATTGVADFAFGGDIAEVIVYNRALTLSERTSILGYLDRHFTYAFTGTAAYTGAGSLVASGIPTPTGTLALTGSGTLASTGVPRPTSTVGFSGSGTLSGSQASIAVSGAGGFTGSGVFAGTQTGVAVLGAGVLTGSGMLATTGTPATSGTAALSGSGTLTAVAIPAIPGAVTLAGAGTLTEIGQPRPVQSVGFTGSGSLVGSGGTLAYAGTAPLTGTGTLTTTGALRAAGQSTLTGVGSLTPTGSPRPAGQVDFTGAGTNVITGTARLTGTATLAGSGTLACIPTAVTVAGAVVLTGDGVLTVHPCETHPAVAITLTIPGLTQPTNTGVTVNAC